MQTASQPDSDNTDHIRDDKRFYPRDYRKFFTELFLIFRGVLIACFESSQ